jgi:hypothetical protein
MGINPLFSTIGRNLYKRSFSKIFDTVGKRLIGLQDVNSLGGLPGFRMRVTCAPFEQDSIE